MKTQTHPGRFFRSLFSLIIIFGLFMSAAPQSASAGPPNGAWLDTLSFEMVKPEKAVDAIKVGDINMYASGLRDGYAAAEVDPDLETEQANSIFYELTFNPSGPEFSGTGKLNPFSVPKIREAMNLLIDRRYLVENIMSDLAEPMFFPINIGFPDYERYGIKVTELEELYAYDLSHAAHIINDEMLDLGAYIKRGKWWYGSEEVTLIFIIRNDGDGLRIPMGDYIAAQLESIGFVVDKQYKTSAQATPIWLLSDPADGLWHMYTGAWSNTMIDRDTADNFQFFYDPSSTYGFTPLWSAYTPTPEFHDLNLFLANNNNFSSMAERDLAFEHALELAMEDSVRIWLVDGNNYHARASDTTTAYDPAVGLARLYPYTVRYSEIAGGHIAVGDTDLFVNPWNPVAGSTWTYDSIPIQATADDALLPDPTNGLPIPQRIVSASVTAQAGLPIYKSSDWVSLDFKPVITVPTDAWADWDATTQKFIPVNKKYPLAAPTALVKSVVTYPADLFETVTWHDGSPISMGDFIMGMILPYDRTDPASDIYDSFATNNLESLIAFRIIDADPLTIETYTDFFQLDAEMNVYTWWPKGDTGPLPWHTTALAAELEAKGYGAFSFDKADNLGVDWINFLAGPSLGNMATLLDSLDNDFIPYLPTLENYIKSDEAIARWKNLHRWYNTFSHFWIGDGPFFVNKFDWTGKQLGLERFESFSDKAGKWDNFSASLQPALHVNYPTGSPGSYFSISGEEFPAGGVGTLSINGQVLTGSLGINAAGRFKIYLLANLLDTGKYTVTVSVNPSASVSFIVSDTAPWRAQDGSGTPYGIPSGIATRLGAWTDSLIFDVTYDDPVDLIKNGDIDLDTSTQITGYEIAQFDPEVETYISNDIFYDLTFNPYGPAFTGTGKLNPFSVPAVREAMNKLIDRNYLVNTVFDGLGEPRFLPIDNGFPDYQLYDSMVTSLESEYSYNYSAAKTVIDTEMLNLGAYKVGDDWYYGGSPVTLGFIIRNDSNGKRIPMGDYIADQLESIGFEVDRQYKSSAEAAPIWLGGDPADGDWHLYTGAWSSTEIDRDEGDNFEFFYSPNSTYGFTLLWQAYSPTPAFADVIDDLAHNNFTNITQRDVAFQTALDLSMEDSVRLWLVEGRNYLSRSVLTTSTYNIAEGISRIYPYTTRFTADAGGDMVIGSSALFQDVWNPVSGSSWTEDVIPINATMDDALLPDPTNAMPMPQRIESAAITAKTGLPVIQTEDWVTLDFDPIITVPPDAWAGWNASTQEWITYEDLYAGGTAPETLVKSTVTYPADLFTTVKWHDGSPLSLGDFVMAMILPFDRTDGSSDIYDAFAYNDLVDIVAFRIASVDPLIIETYLSAFQLEAELNVHTWWPNTNYGPQPWHTTALASKVEAGGWAAFSHDKADHYAIPQINYISGPVVAYLDQELTLTDPEYIPYGNTLEDYISTAEAMARWSNLQSWFNTYSHFWVGDGAFYLDTVDVVNRQITLTRYADFPDVAGKYDEFNEVAVAALHINYTEGSPGSWFTVIGENYPPYFTNGSLYVNGFLMTSTLTGDEYGSFLFLLNTDDADVGAYVVTVEVNPIASTNFILRETAPTRPLEDSGGTFFVPAGIAYQLIYLPLIIR